MVFKNHTATVVSSKCQNEAHTLPSVVVRTSIKIFHALFGVRPHMRRLSQALQIECSCIKHEFNSSNNFYEQNGSKQSQESKESAR